MDLDAETLVYQNGSTDMPPWLSVVVTVVIAALTVIVNAVVSTKIKFAPDVASATRELKQLGSGVVRWTLNFAMIAMLVYQGAKPQPLNRVDVLVIAMNVSGLFFVLVTALLTRTVDVLFGSLSRVMDALRLQAESQGRHIDLTERLVDATVARTSGAPDASAARDQLTTAAA